MKRNKQPYDAERYKLRRELVARYKDQPCADCGLRYDPVCMDFDHVRGEKEFSIGSHVISCSLERLLNEIAKCDVVCANCHRLRTWKRRRIE